MAADPDVLDVSRLSVGLLVEYLGPTDAEPALLVVGVGYPAPLCDRLWQGHPGVIAEPVPQHVLVTWVGLEDAVASFVLGFSSNDQGFYGLGILSAAEYESRRQRILAGGSPTVCNADVLEDVVRTSADGRGRQ